MLILAKDRVREPLHCVVPLFNPWRWKSRWKHAERALKHFIDAGAVVTLVECAFNRRELVFADSGLDGAPASCPIQGHGFRHRYIGLRTGEELWLKENLINLGVQSLPHDWQQVCWLDGDVHFLRPNWVGECIHKLQHYAFLQMFSHARDVGPDYEMLPDDYPHADGLGFVTAWERGVEMFGSSYAAGSRVWPGLAWACTRQAWDDVGGLIDVAIWGGADWHMAHALVEKRDGMMRADLHRNYKKIINQWAERCRTHVRRNVGTMAGTIVHHWHGKKAKRGYNAKHSLLAKFGFDPLRHLKRDSQGLWQLHDDRSTAFVRIRDMFRRIATERNEDSIDL